MSTEINSKIVGVAVKKVEAGSDASFVHVDELPFYPQDVDPLTLRIESRPEGSLEAVSEKITYVGAEGKKKVYVLVSFMPVSGLIGGKEVTIERPVEFFFPASQLSSEYQWISASMRSLSLAARGGYITQALQDLRKVAWDKGLVRCGWNKYGKPAFHDSEVAAIAWSIQQILLRRGFLDDDGNQVPLEQLIHSYNVRHGKLGVDFTPESVAPATQSPTEWPDLTSEVKFNEPSSDSAETVPSDDTKAKSVGMCPECQSDLVLMDGCPTCVEGCGWSKCG